MGGPDAGVDIGGPELGSKHWAVLKERISGRA